MKVYISGKIGEEVISEATRQKFAKAEKILKAKGFEVFNPCDEQWQEVLRDSYLYSYFDKARAIPACSVSFYTYALLRDLMVLSTKDAVLMLEDWKDSEGAQAEYKFAKAAKKKIFFASEKDAINELWSIAQSVNPDIQKMNLSKGIKMCEEYSKLHKEEVWIQVK